MPKTQPKRRPAEKRPVSEFRRIDLAFLKLARRRVIPIIRGQAKGEVELVLPVWGVTDFPYANRVRIRNVGSGPFVESNMNYSRMEYLITILRDAQWANEQALQLVFRDRGNAQQFGVVAVCPPPPDEVRKSVCKVASKFDEVFIAFEADWREDASVYDDPLIIGVRKVGIVEESFLLAVYDPTKLEHYIASEFTTL